MKDTSEVKSLLRYVVFLGTQPLSTLLLLAGHNASPSPITKFLLLYSPVLRTWVQARIDRIVNPQANLIRSAKRYNGESTPYLFHVFRCVPTRMQALAVPESVVHSESSFIFPLWLSNPAACPMTRDLVEPQCSTCP